MTIVPMPGQSEKELNSRLAWAIKDLTSTSIEIQLLFDDKGAISQSEEGDTILVLLNLQ